VSATLRSRCDRIVIRASVSGYEACESRLATVCMADVVTMVFQRASWKLIVLYPTVWPGEDPSVVSAGAGPTE
jgi:hypothetical protein